MPLLRSIGSDVVLPGQESVHAALEEKRHAKTVVDGVLMRTSPSAIQLHDTCPRKWWFAYVKGEKEPSTKAQERGTEGHSRIEHFLRHNQNVLGPLEIPGLVAGLIPTPGPGLLIEHDFELQTSAGFPVTGRIDLINTRGGAARWNVVDWKFKGGIDKYGSREQDLINPETKEGVQMLAYSAVVAKMPSAPLEIGLSHVQFETKRRANVVECKQALALDTAVTLWQKVESRLPAMRETAKAAHHLEVLGNDSACFSYHKLCMHHSKCFPDPSQRLAALIRGTPSQFKEDNTMALISKSKPAPTTSPAPVPAPVSQPVAAPVSSPVPAAAPSTAGAAAATGPGLVSVLPPDQPKPEKPVSKLEFQIGDGQLVTAEQFKAHHAAEASKARAAALLGQSSSPPAAMQATVPSPGGSPGGSTTVVTSAPGGEISKPKRGRKPASQPTGMTEGDLEQVRALVPPTQSSPPSAKPDVPAVKVSNAPTAPAGILIYDGVVRATAPAGIFIYDGCAPMGVATKSILPLVQSLNDQIIKAAKLNEDGNGIADLRACTDSALGFNKWKAYLAEVTKAELASGNIPGGLYVVTESDERVKVVVDELGARLPAGSVTRRLG